MFSRKRGFTFIELLIVLAVIAALLASITPVAMNAIRKAKAIQVAFNLKVLAGGIQNKLLLDHELPSNISEIGRDIDTQNYGIAYTYSGGHYVVVVFTTEEVTFDTVHEILPASTDSTAVIPAGASYLAGGLQSADNATVLYRIEFDIY